MGHRLLRARLLLAALAEPPHEVRQRDIADAVGISQGLVAKWEADKRTPSLKVAARLAGYLGVRMEWLAAGQGVMYDSTPLGLTLAARLATMLRIPLDRLVTVPERRTAADELHDIPVVTFDQDADSDADEASTRSA